MRVFISDKGYETSSIDKVLQAIAEDPTGEARGLHETITSSTIKADAANEQADFQSGLAQGSAADLQAMSLNSAVQSHRNLNTSTVPSDSGSDHRHIDLHKNNVHGLSSREAMPPPAMPGYHHQSPQPVTTPRSIRSASRPGQSSPTMNTPAQVLRSNHWTPTSHVPTTSSRHFPSADVYPQFETRQDTSHFHFPNSITPQKRGHNEIAQETNGMHEKTSNRVRYGREGEVGGNGSTFNSINSPHKRTTPGLYAGQFSDQTRRDLHATLSSNARSELAGNGRVTDYTCDLSTPRATRHSAEHRRKAVPRDTPDFTYLRGGASDASLGSSIGTSPSTLRPTSFANSLQSFALHGDPVNTYIEQRYPSKRPSMDM